MSSKIIADKLGRVDRNDRTPLYIQVHEHLTKMIAQGEETIGKFLPSERDLAKIFDVDRLTVRKALSILEDEGLIKKRSGARTIINTTSRPIGKRAISQNFLWILPRGYDYLDRISEPFNAMLFNHVERLVSSEGYNLIYRSVSEDDDFEKILDSLELLGIFFISNVPKHLIQIAYNNGIPGVVANAEDKSYPCVLGDRKNGVEQALDHLIQLGHKEIAFIGGTPGYLNAELSFAGYKEIFEKNNLTLREELIKVGFWNFDGGYRAMQDLLENSTIRPTGVFAADDSMAFGAIEAIRDAKLQIPDDISIVGFDNIERRSCSSLSLTTVNLDIESVATNAWWILKNQIAGSKILNTKTILPVELVIRESTAPIRRTVEKR
jgi:LacI family transcriptional regulator